MRHYRVMVTARLHGVPESKIEAYKWLHLAAAQGFQGSEAACETVALVMTREEVADGNRRAAAFEADHFDRPQAQS
jgi:TPR repeat protein